MLVIVVFDLIYTRPLRTKFINLISPPVAASLVPDQEIKEEIFTSLQLFEELIGKELLLPNSYSTSFKIHAQFLEFNRVNRSQDEIWSTTIERTLENLEQNIRDTSNNG